jgi:ribosomal protein S18 acetylase RimI-like enzyme
MESPIEIRCLAPADLPAADKLRAAAGWNQTLADWQRMVALDPAGCFVATAAGEVVGTATTASYGLDLAWIGMVLVDPSRRNRGIGRRLLLHCLEYLRAQGVRCIKLDATPAGQALYEKLGFEVEWPLARWMRPGSRGGATQPDDISIAAEHDVAAIEQLDGEVIGVVRRDLLRGLWEYSLGAVASRRADGDLDGFGFRRDGVDADYIGPIVARTERTGRAIVAHLLGPTRRPVFWDIPEPCGGAVTLATELGFTRQRPLVRMHLGADVHSGDPHLLWAISDPATG